MNILNVTYSAFIIWSRTYSINFKIEFQLSLIVLQVLFKVLMAYQIKIELVSNSIYVVPVDCRK